MSNYSNAVLSLTPVAYYRLNQASGTVAADSSGNSHAGALAGTITYSMPGALPSDSDTALGFTASGGLNLPGIDMTAWTGYTLVFWGLVSSRWQMVAYTCDSNGGERLYLNGSPYLGGAGDVFVVAADLSAAGFVGGGDLDEVALYQSVLSPAQVAMLWLAAGYSAPTPKFFITAKNKLTNLAVAAGIERKMASFSCVPRFNALGSWQLVVQDTVLQPSPLASVFLRDGSGNLHNGIYVAMDNEDGNGPQYVISGPQTDVDVKVDPSGLRTLTVTGADEKYWLKYRRALQNPVYVYASNITGFLTPWRYYELDETSGTVATDNGSSPHNGTYTGTFTLNKPGLVDDPAACVLLDGSSGYISVPTASLPSGNSAITVFGWGLLPALPASTATMWSWGTDVSGESFQVGILSGGFPYCALHGAGDLTGATAITPGVPFFLGMTWDGTTLKGYCYQQGNGNSGLFGTQTPGAASITFGNVNLGRYVTGAQYWPGFLAQATMQGGAVVQADFDFIFAVGTSRQVFATYDFRSGQGSTVIREYVDANAGPSAQPSVAFTNWMLTHPARPVPNLTLAADPLLGNSIQGIARMDNLLDFIGALALQSSPELGFKLEQTSTDLLFTVFQPADKTTTAVFSLDRRNLLQGYEWKQSIAAANYVYVGGANSSGSANLADRLFSENDDATSVNQYGLLEDFLDFRQGSTGQSLQQAISGQLAQDAQQLTFNGTITNTPTLYYKGPGDAGWDLGDTVTVLADGQVFQEVIREVQIDLQPGQPALITAAIGTPVDAQIMQESQALQSRLQSLQQSSNTLKTNY